MKGPYTALGWHWGQLNGGGVAHLVPARILQWSGTACRHYRLQNVLITDPTGLLVGVQRCALCRAANHGEE